MATNCGRIATEVRGTCWVNVLLGKLKRAICGSYPAIEQAKSARRYLAEAVRRFNRRFRLTKLVSRLAIAMMHSKPHAEPKLRMATNFVS